MPTRCRATCQCASFNTDMMSSAKVPASESPNLTNTTVDPANGWRMATSLACSLGLIRRCASRCWSSRSFRSAVAARSCCLAAASWSVATCPVKVRLSFLSCSTPSLASWILVSESLRIASCSLFPESQVSHVKMAITIAVRSRIPMYSEKILPLRDAATSIGFSFLDWTIVITITAFAITGAILGLAAIRANNRRLNSIRRRYCNTQIRLDKH